MSEANIDQTRVPSHSARYGSATRFGDGQTMRYFDTELAVTPAKVPAWAYGTSKRPPAWLRQTISHEPSRFWTTTGTPPMARQVRS